MKAKAPVLPAQLAMVSALERERPRACAIEDSEDIEAEQAKGPLDGVDEGEQDVVHGQVDQLKRPHYVSRRP
jgi:hypothetical protein